MTALRIGREFAAHLARDNLRINDQVMAVVDAGNRQRFFFAEALAALFVVEAVAHGLAVGVRWRSRCR